MFEHTFKNRVIAFLLFISFAFLLFFCRLTFLQIINAENLQNLAMQQWTRGLSIKAKRGTIYDRNGIELAVSYSTYNVYVRPVAVKNMNKVCYVLSTYLDLDYDYVYEKITKNKVSEVLIKSQVDNDTAVKIFNNNLNGVYLSENTKRYYPYGDFLSQVLGYTTIDNIGQSGLELYYDKYLKGIDGKTLTETDIKGIEIDNTLDLYLSSIAGCSLYLTIDYYIQFLVQNALKQIMEVEKPKSATIIVMDPKSSEILAMASSPSFDLNNLPRDNINELMQYSKCLSIVDVYEPGSTFKVLTTATALEEGKTTPNESFYDPGYRIIDGEKIKCWKLIGHGQQTMTDGLCNSCNSVFVDLSLRLGKDKMYEYFEKYGFGKVLNVDFSGESAGIIMDYDTAKQVDLARMGFGQAIAVTPIQMINAISSVLNGGKLNQPYFLKKVTNPNNEIIKENSTTFINRVISEKTSAQIREMLEAVIIKANAISAFIPGYRVSGKTGTSQKYANGAIASGLYTSSFVGAFPADNPDYVVLVIVDEPSSGAYYGSIVATPYAKQIFQGIIEYKKIPPLDTLESDMKKMEKTISMPNLIGKSLTEACTILTELGLQYELDGEGGIIKNQLPLENTMLYKNAVTLLYT